MNQQSWSVNLANSINNVPGNIHQFQSLLDVGTTLRARFAKVTFVQKQTIPVNYPKPLSAELSTILKPYHSSTDLSFSFPVRQNSKLNFHYSSLHDTVNTDVTKQNSIIGKIYALDHNTQEIGICLETSSFDVVINYKQLYGDLRGYVLVSYFGNILSLLSGARYYQQLEIDLSYLELQFLTQQKVRDWMMVSFANSIFLGQAIAPSYTGVPLCLSTF